MSNNDTGPGLVRQVISAVAARFDSLGFGGWMNDLTGLGTDRDKRAYTTFELPHLTDEQLEVLYRGDGIHARCVDLLPDECWREGFEVRVPKDAGLAAAINSKLSELNAEAHLADADVLSRKYRGALVLMGTTDRKGRPSVALRDGDVESVDHLNTFSSREAWAYDYYGELDREKYGDVSRYYLAPLFGGYVSRGWEMVHHTRVLRFNGQKVERHTRQALLGWDDPLLLRLHHVIRDWAAGYAGTANLLQDAAQGVFKLPELTKLLLSNRPDVVAQKMAIIDQRRSSMRSLFLGEGESFERQATPFTGIPDALHALDFMLTAVVGHPLTVFLGQSPATLNSGGSASSDVEIFRGSARARQRKLLTPIVSTLVRTIFLSRKGPSKGKEPERWSIYWRPLSQPSPTDTATVKKLHAETDEIRIRSNVITPTIARTRFQGDEYADEVSIEADPFDTEAEDFDLPDEDLPQLPDGKPQEGLEAAPGTGLPGGAEKVADTALNGAQLKEAREIILSVARGELPRDSGIGLLEVGYNLETAEAERMMASVGRGFTASTPPPAPPPFGGQRPPPPEDAVWEPSESEDREDSRRPAKRKARAKTTPAKGKRKK